MKIDLHLHTTASDGKLTPEEIIAFAVKVGLDVIAITDHDSVNGVAPALAAARLFLSLTVIPGVEINTDVPHGEVHILGYFIDYTNPKLCSQLERLRSSREERGQKMVAKLHALGVDIKWRRVQELAKGGSIGRPHIAQALLEAGYIASIKEAFVKYIGRSGPAYVEREKITPPDAVELIATAQGLPVLAHPADIDNLDRFVSELKAVGLVGIEVYYDGYSPEVINRLIATGDKYNLVFTGGSDYHGLDAASETMPGEIDLPSEVVEQLCALSIKSSLELMKP